MKNAIITPTYSAHFPFIHKYLSSFKTYVEDKKSVPIYFTIIKKEESEFNKIVKCFENILDIKILFFEDVLRHFEIKYTQDTLLRKYDKFSFQTLKKFYSMLYVDADRYLILDSESMCIRHTNIYSLFSNFFASPFICYSDCTTREYIHPFALEALQHAAFLVNSDISKWFLEHFVWFYERRILEDMFHDHGDPMEMAEKVWIHFPNQISGIFEILIYSAYLLNNCEKYGYTAINTTVQLDIALGTDTARDYTKLFTKVWLGGGGLLELALSCLTEANTELLANLFKRLRFNIIRCEEIRNYKLQKKFISIVQPNILAASQNHCFGLNDSLTNRLKADYNFRLCKDHIKAFCRPIKYFIKWTLHPVFVIKYTLKIIRNLLWL